MSYTERETEIGDDWADEDGRPAEDHTCMATACDEVAEWNHNGQWYCGHCVNAELVK